MAEDHVELGGEFAGLGSGERGKGNDKGGRVVEAADQTVLLENSKLTREPQGRKEGVRSGKIRSPARRQRAGRDGARPDQLRRKFRVSRTFPGVSRRSRVAARGWCAPGSGRRLVESEGSVHDAGGILNLSLVDRD